MSPIVRPIKMACLSIAAWALWELGYPQQALKYSHDSLQMVRALPHTYSLAAAFGFAAMHAQLRRDVQAVQEQSERAITLAIEHGFPQVLAFSIVFHGWALAQQSQVEEGISEMRRGIEAWHATGAKAALSWLLALLAEAYGSLGQSEEGLQKLTEAFVHVDNTGERFRALSRYGPYHARTICMATRAENAQAVVTEIQKRGGAALTLGCRVELGAEVTVAFARVQDTVGPVSIVVNNAKDLSEDSSACRLRTTAISVPPNSNCL
jgi:predicted ATPase